MLIKELIKYLDILFPNPRCELNYHKDYEFLIAVVLSAQTTDKAVNKVTSILFNKYDTLDKLNNANIEDIIDIIRPIGTWNRKSRYIKDITKSLIEIHDSIVPNNREALELLPGVGRKVANVVLSELFKIPTIAVDTHVTRVSIRLKLAKEKDNVITIEKKLMKIVAKDNWSKFHHQMVLFGRYYCKAAKPECNTCHLKDLCNYNKKVKEIKIGNI